MTPNLPPSTDTTSGTTSPEENKEHFQGHTLSKFDYELYKDEDDIAMPIVRVKRIGLPNKGERWKVFCGNEVKFVLEGSKLAKKERKFLQSVEGVNWLLAQAKIGINSFNAFKKELKKKMAPPAANKKKKVRD